MKLYQSVFRVDVNSKDIEEEDLDEAVGIIETCLADAIDVIRLGLVKRFPKIKESLEIDAS